MQQEVSAVTVDLNADMGEGFGSFTVGNDQALLDIVTSANVACGFHAGDPEIMARIFRTARELGVNVGAHPGFPDLWGFGRRNIPFTPDEIERLVAYQIGAAQALSAYAGNPITYVKAHGALGNLTQTNRDVAKAICRATKAVDGKLICMSFAGGALLDIAADMGLPTCSEIFADRAYDDTGNLVPRGVPGATIHDESAAAHRVVRMLRTGAVETVTGKQIKVSIDTICIHGDSPSAVSMAKHLRATLEQSGIKVRPFAGAMAK